MGGGGGRGGQGCRLAGGAVHCMHCMGCHGFASGRVQSYIGDCPARPFPDSPRRGLSSHGGLTTFQRGDLEKSGEPFWVCTAGSTHRKAMAAAVPRRLRLRHVHHRIPRVELGLLEPGFVRFGRLQRLQCPLGGARGLHLMVHVWEPVPRACWWAGCKGGRDIPRPIFQGESEFRTGADWFQAPRPPQPPTCTLPACKVGGGWAGGMHLHVPRWLEWGGTAPTLME